MGRLIFFLSLILVGFQSCSNSDDDNPYMDSVCDEITRVDKNRFEQLQSEGFEIADVQVNGDCLEVEIISGGCSGETWQAELIDAGYIAESYPIQRGLKLILENKELCNAVVSRRFTFDLRPVRASSDVVSLNLEHWKEQIRYEY